MGHHTIINNASNTHIIIILRNNHNSDNNTNTNRTIIIIQRRHLTPRPPSSCMTVHVSTLTEKLVARSCIHAIIVAKCMSTVMHDSRCRELVIDECSALKCSAPLGPKSQEITSVMAHSSKFAQSDASNPDRCHLCCWCRCWRCS